MSSMHRTIEGEVLVRHLTRDELMIDPEKTIVGEHGMGIRKHRRPISVYLFIACGTWLIGLGIYFMFLRPALLPEDLRYIGTSAGEIEAAMPGLESWTHRVFTVMGGFMLGTGVLTILAAMNASTAPPKWTRIALGLAGIFTVGTMSLTNFQLDSDFKRLLLIPSVLWLIAMVFSTVTNGRDGEAN